ncbi:MAG: hypothetical protein Q4B10_07510 [Actinomycetaceae bacterium]|nr:hypothetical protein [Actinomycetaceae bacterium]
MTPTLTDEKTQASNEFTAADRCDVCGAQAWVRAFFSSGILLFCAHHAREHSGALEAAERVDDGRSDGFAIA